MATARWGIHASSDETLLSQFLLKYAKGGMKCLQIFFGSPQSLTRKNLSEQETQACLKVVKDYDLSLNTHFPYTFNMCNPDLNMAPLQTEIRRVAAIGGRVVLHTGSCTSACCSNRDLNKATLAVKTTWAQDWREGADVLIKHLESLEYPNNVDYPLLLEPPAGEGKKLGWNLEQLKYIFDRCPKQVGFCLDTCHSFAAGLCSYKTGDEVMTFFDQLEAALGDMKRFKLIHLNDSEDPFGSMKDRHAILRQGHIWSKLMSMDGLVMLWLLASQHDINIVSECGTLDDIEVMREIVKGIQDAENDLKQ